MLARNCTIVLRVLYGNVCSESCMGGDGVFSELLCCSDKLFCTMCVYGFLV